MNTVPLLLRILALGCFLLATFPPASPYRDRLVSAGLAFGVASTITW